MRRFSLLLMLVLGASGCEEELEQFFPAANYDPKEVLNFGVVSVLSEKTLPIKVVSNGRAALKVSDALISPSAKDGTQVETGPFRAKIDPALESLRPSDSSTITVTYRPCPDAWEGGWAGNTLKQNYDFGTKCPTTAEAVELQIVDNTRLGSAKIQVSGTPGQPPKIELACRTSRGHCGKPVEGLSSEAGCTALAFGDVTPDAPCDLALEIRNKKRGSNVTGDLVVERLDMLVYEGQDSTMTLLQGSDVGFSLLDAEGNPLVVDSDHPLTIPIEEGKQVGAKAIKIRYTGAKPGTYTGAKPSGGLRVYSNDPDVKLLTPPVVTALLSASGTAPDIEVLFPRRIDFKNVAQGNTATQKLAVRNNGNATLKIQDIRFKNTAGNTFKVTTSRGAAPFDVATIGEMNTFELEVEYTPTGGADADTIVISSNDPDSPQTEVPVAGGAVPQISVDPTPTLVFALPNPPPPPPVPARTGKLVISNLGYGPLSIQQLSIVGPAPDEDPTHSSVDDFKITGCAANPCPQTISLCPPDSTTCMTPSTTELEISYLNNDASQTDLVSLKIASNDPVNPVWTVVLSAEDRPCLFPTPVIQLLTMPPVANQEVQVSGTTSSPGSGTMLTKFTWSFRFTPGAPPTITPVVPGDDSVIKFTPTQPGLHIIALQVVNDCGATSQTLEAERVNVVPPN